MAFIQIIEYTTARYDEIDSLMDQWVAATEGKRRAARSVTCSDRDRANAYVEIVYFPSYEQAMENSSLPETANFAEQVSKLCDEGPTFRNLEVLRTDEL